MPSLLERLPATPACPVVPWQRSAIIVPGEFEGLQAARDDVQPVAMYVRPQMWPQGGMQFLRGVNQFLRRATCSRAQVPTQVNYVAKGCPIYDEGEAVPGSSSVITKYLRTAYLWDRVRVQGGAYGCALSFSRLSGMASYSSYRDPNVVSTLQVSCEHLRRLGGGAGQDGGFGRRSA